METTANSTNDAQNGTTQNGQSAGLPNLASDSVLKKTNFQLDTAQAKGYDFNQGINYADIIKSYATTGFQATALSKSIDIINKMLKWRLSDEPINHETEDDELKDIEVRKKVKCTIFLGYTSNLISSGMREIFKFLVQHKLVDCIVTTAGGVEEDFIKCLGPTYLGDYYLNDVELRKNGINRIANLLVPNDNYCKFEEWIMPIYDEMWAEQKKTGYIWTPSRVIRRLGERINNPDSVYYWAAKNKIPVFCPAFTDGSMGDMLFFHSYNKERFQIDLVKDIRKLNKRALKAKKTGAVILGGGIVKHHILNANLMRNGADFAVFLNTGNEWDGSDAGARPSEALSWGKLKLDSQSVKVWADATLVFPIIVAESFAKYYFENLKVEEKEKEQKADEQPQNGNSASEVKKL